MSLGGAYSSKTLEDAVIYAYTHGMVQVATAGNSGSGSVLYPAKYAPVIAVAATDNTNTRAWFSNYGPEVDLTAPGSAIYSLIPGGAYDYRSGTSMAAPFVLGLAAILIGLPGNYDAGWVERQMCFCHRNYS
jgi:thermitase